MVIEALILERVAYLLEQHNLAIFGLVLSEDIIGRGDSERIVINHASDRQEHFGSFGGLVLQLIMTKMLKQVS